MVREMRQEIYFGLDGYVDGGASFRWLSAVVGDSKIMRHQLCKVRRRVANEERHAHYRWALTIASPPDDGVSCLQRNIVFSSYGRNNVIVLVCIISSTTQV